MDRRTGPARDLSGTCDWNCGTEIGPERGNIMWSVQVSNTEWGADICDRRAGPGNVLGKETPDAKEFDGLVRSGLARLRDAEKQENSLESRFDLAYGAAHALLAVSHVRRAWAGRRRRRLRVVRCAWRHARDRSRHDHDSARRELLARAISATRTRAAIVRR